MSEKRPRIARESKTVAVMISDYCHDHHENDAPCPECRELINYALKRLKKCPYQEGKTTCVLCPTHCYLPDMREKIRKVMMYVGPRMIYRHPVLALMHIIDGRRKKPVKNI